MKETVSGSFFPEHSVDTPCCNYPHCRL